MEAATNMPEIVKPTSKNAHWHRPDRTKCCIICHETKALDDFYSYPYTTSQGKRSIRYESRCKPCSITRRKARSASLPGYDAENAARWRQENEDQVIAYRRKYQGSDHGRKIRAKNQRIRSARQRAGTDNEDPRIAALYQEAADWETKLAACVVSDDPLDLKVHVDHKQPLSKGGEHVFDNLQILDARVNMQKGAIPYSAWTGGRNA